MIPYGKHHIDEDDIQAVVDVLRSGMLTQGPAVEAFENAVAAYVGAKYAVGVSSGTAALHLAALVAGIGPGTTLITSPITFVASANSGLYAGGQIAFADIDPDTVNMSPVTGVLTVELPRLLFILAKFIDPVPATPLTGKLKSAVPYPPELKVNWNCAKTISPITL